jgi:ATP-dependent RNA circularization protein (DNA/RNA ligase family)
MSLGRSRYYFDERVRGLKVRALECGSSSYRLSRGGAFCSADPTARGQRGRC